jgi:beta-lactamase regulating signal transducer with metallopeptidase domain
VSFDVRLVVIALSAYMTASLAASALVSPLWRRLHPGPPGRRAAAIVRLRLLPATLAAFAAVFAILSCLEFEPRTLESAGVVLQSLAVAAGILLAAATVRAVRLQLATRNARRAWLASAKPISLQGISIPSYSIASAFPIVAVVGVFRPVLIIAQSVLDHCSAEELGAILAHERGHLVRRDNAHRALFAWAPDVLMWHPLSRRLARDWHDATEEASDDDAGRSSEYGRLHLAEALITVARLAPAGHYSSVVPASALYRGENLERRISRLLSPTAELEFTPYWTWKRLVTTTALLTLGAFTLRAIHDLVEAAVTFLP